MKSKQKVAFITGITGQDGSYLAELLISKNYKVHGLIRRSSTFNTKRIDHLYIDPHNNPSLILHYGDMSDASNLERILAKIQPDEIYNLAAQSHVRVSFDMPVYTGDICALGTTRLLEAIKESKIKTKFYQASSSEMFGRVVETPQSEKTPFYPRSPYGVSKVYAYWSTVNYRESYNLFACNGILFNHESPRRGETFVTRKIAKGLVRIKNGLENKLFLGNLNAKRDWGYAPDFVEAMWLMLQHSKPDDYVVATGETHTVKEFIEEAAKLVDIKIKWTGTGSKEKGIDINTKKTIIEVDPTYYRPTEVDILQGDPRKIKKNLGWKPKTKFDQLVKLMITAEINDKQNQPIVTKTLHHSNNNIYKINRHGV